MLQCVVNTVLLRRLRIFIAIKEKLEGTKQRVIVISVSFSEKRFSNFSNFLHYHFEIFVVLYDTFRKKTNVR